MSCEKGWKLVAREHPAEPALLDDFHLVGEPVIERHLGGEKIAVVGLGPREEKRLRRVGQSLDGRDGGEWKLRILIRGRGWRRIKGSAPTAQLFLQLFDLILERLGLPILLL